MQHHRIKSKSAFPFFLLPSSITQRGCERHHQRGGGADAAVSGERNEVFFCSRACQVPLHSRVYLIGVLGVAVRFALIGLGLSVRVGIFASCTVCVNPDLESVVSRPPFFQPTMRKK